MDSIAVTKREDPVYAALNALDAAVDTLLATDANAMNTKKQIFVLRRIEAVSNRLPAVGNQLLTALREEATPAELGDTVARSLANALRISPAAANRRIADAQELGPRRTLSGERLQPWLPATAAAQRDGRIGNEHVKVLRDFFAQLPNHVDAPTRAHAERELVQFAKGLRPDELKKLAQRMDLVLNPDGNFSDVDRARKRGVTLGPQHRDGMSSLRGQVTPELRATLEALFGKLAAPGMCNPDDESPRVDGDPDPETARRDGRTHAQRQHDALLAACRSVLCSGELGSHHGLPVTIVVTTPLEKLEAGTGMAVTGSGTLVPMSDVIRWASHSYHYLAVFDRHTEIPLYLGRSRRTASIGQRIMLHATDRGCSFPGCTVPGYLCQADHIDEWVNGGPTDITNFALDCTSHHKLHTNYGWKIRKRPDGRTEWIPPPQLELPSGVNDYHHPEKLLGPNENAPE